ncbi:CAAX prenyl protease [Coemansia sp. RSA 1807]|nr:CAAX prenyl protease [Coemansia sp. RSA 1824]KAJ2139098.1 CAAX prenyl protease [Coemansia sp. RSA 788]KAJ2147822.1 CAAX prenyl protease [Coemansia sp. RSA 564]KAJ2190473.1 CAAX prenyl protease [Coemansia sp. RSA 532]KAJ2208174.1 CAAX prenyl protease [Coemansia sp. RSA 521]KAJ2230407.1 CAAX prenyl protease [Coemansia sp. RSA 518]KAJ2278230.1 CAAX prenyl protease [Coemansia sp. RSA 371]KAJ2409442.1 CAAX prenyl protease [Coemansia sp. RSA 2526]KAJ2572491.1 CAAX prenyl protease [Coemansia sp
MYVASIYLFMALFPTPLATIHDRDHPHIMKQRMRGVTLATLVSLAATSIVLWHWQSLDVRQIVSQLGLDPRTAVPSVVVALVLMCVLFLGPLITSHLEGGCGWDVLKRVPSSLWNQPIYLRNYVVGPITEELVFRSCVVALWSASNLSMTMCVFVSPVIFGVAHVHRAVSLYVKGDALGRILLSTLLQLLYTTVFGWIAAGLFVRTRSVMGPIVAHIFCNLQGLPDFAKASQYPSYKYFIWLAFVVGLVGFLVLFEPMTRPGVFVPE